MFLRLIELYKINLKTMNENNNPTWNEHKYWNITPFNLMISLLMLDMRSTDGVAG